MDGRQTYTHTHIRTTKIDVVWSRECCLLFNWISSTVYYKRGETNVRTEFSAEVLRERRLNVFFFIFFFLFFFNSLILSCKFLLPFLLLFVRRRKDTHTRNTHTFSLSFLHSLFLVILFVSFTYTHIQTHILILSLAL